jgi:hypothetical protein
MKLICSFDSDVPEFTRGFEAGMIWARIAGCTDDALTIHASNTEMIMRMAEAAEVGFSAEDLGNDWLAVIFH